jgi:hypothetical protein
MGDNTMQAPLMDEPAPLSVDVAELQREVDALSAWCQTPEAKAEAAEIMREAEEMWAEFEAECKSGKYDLTPAEIEQLRKDGVLVKCYPIKRRQNKCDKKKSALGKPEFAKK